MAEIDILPENRRNETERILSIVANGLIVTGSVIAPNILSLLGQQLNSSDRKMSKTIRAVRYAKSQGWLTLRDTDRGVEVALTESGKLKWQKLELEKPLAMKKWDKKWRIVLFDIPVSYKLQGEAFRNHLQRIGFCQLQKSVWITPYPCSSIIAALRQIYEIKNNVRLIEAISIDDEASLKRRFRL